MAVSALDTAATPALPATVQPLAAGTAPAGATSEAAARYTALVAQYRGQGLELYSPAEVTWREIVTLDRQVALTHAAQTRTWRGRLRAAVLRLLGLPPAAVRLRELLLAFEAGALAEGGYAGYLPAGHDDELRCLLLAPPAVQHDPAGKEHGK